MLATPELLQEAAQPRLLTDLMSRCAVEVPLYNRNRVESSHSGWASGAREFSRWPVITKEDIRRGFPDNFLGANADLEELVDGDEVELEHTSGTSEERIELLLPRGWWAEQEQRALVLNASVAEVLRQNPEARRATINSPVCSGDIRYNGVPSRTDRTIGNALFVSLSRYPFLWGERDLERMAEEIEDWRPVFLDVDPVYGVVFARYCERHGVRLPSLRFIVCSYEFVSVAHRRILQRAFGVPVFDLYGSTETGHLLMEDETGEMRPSLGTAFLELHDTDEQGVGDLVVSTLTNEFMPLIRYRIGDLVERSEKPYGMRYILHGRRADAFRLTEGARVTTRQVDQCFGGLSGIAHYQLIQRGASAWELRLVPDAPGPGADGVTQLKGRLAQLLRSPAGVTIRETDILVPERSGKFRLGYPAKRAEQNQPPLTAEGF